MFSSTLAGSTRFFMVVGCLFSAASANLRAVSPVSVGVAAIGRAIGKIPHIEIYGAPGGSKKLSYYIVF